MTLRVLQRVRDLFSPAGTAEVRETRQPYFSDSEIGLIKLKLRENSAVALQKQKERGTAVHPRILAARENGAAV